MTRSYGGLIRYAHETDGAFGRERFSVTVHEDGSRTLRCQCWMDNVPLVRDVVYTVNDRFEALDCFVRVVSEGSFVGSGWFRFTDNLAEAEVFTAKEGRVHQQVETRQRVKLFGSHPISIDIWKCTHTPMDAPGTIRPLSNCFSSSLVPNGASGPMLNAKTYDIVYEGAETRETPVGTLACQRFNWDTYTGRTLVMRTAGADWLPVSVHVPESGRMYELVELEGDWQ